MAVVPILDLRGPQPPAPVVPSNLEAEIAFLGTLLVDAAGALDGLEVPIAPEHFHEALFGEIFRLICRTRDAGLTVEISALDAELKVSKARLAYQDGQIGGVKFLLDALDKAPGTAAAATLAQAIVEAFNRRRLIALADEIGRLAREGDGEGDIDSAAIIELAESGLLEMQRADAKLAFTSIVEAADAVTDYLDDRTAGQGVQFGIGAMHELTGPMMAGELFLVAGRPGMGKSVLGTNIALRVAAPLWWREQEFSDNLDAFSAGEAINARYHLGLPESAGVMEINGEMSGGQMMRRHYADIGFAMFGDRFPSYKDIRLKHVSTEQRAMVDEVKAAVRDWPLVMVKRSGLKVSQLRSMARRQTAKWLRDGVKPGLLILDHVGLLRPEGRTTGRYEAQTEIAIGLHQLADDLGLPILALVQMNREAEKRDNKRPQLSDLRDSGGWEENADVVIFPFREAYYALREDAPDDNKNAGADWATWDARCRSKAMEIIPGKVREGGAGKPQTIWCDVAWNALRPTEPRAKGAMI